MTYSALFALVSIACLVITVVVLLRAKRQLHRAALALEAKRNELVREFARLEIAERRVRAREGALHGRAPLPYTRAPKCELCGGSFVQTGRNDWQHLYCAQS